MEEAGSKAAIIWIIGENADTIQNAQQLLEPFLNNFSEEEAVVQLQLLTSCVKLFLKKPQSAQNLVQSVLTSATQECDNPDIRDRAYIYWRLLSSSADLAKVKLLYFFIEP